MFRPYAAVAIVAALAVPAAADGPGSSSDPANPAIRIQRGRAVVDTPLSAFTPHAAISPYLYLNRCSGGCNVTGGTINDARQQMSTIPTTGPHVIGEFQNDAGLVGTAADAEWQQVVQCMKEVYSPFNITVTDTPPGGGNSYTEAIIAGQPADIGQGPGVLGIAPISGDCSAQDNVISFSFANHHPVTDRVLNICWTAAQETAHAFGLDHEYQFSDGTSACNDPMTYRTDCGGEKFFRNKAAQCGEDMVRDCRCGGSQNSHIKILGVFGAGTSLIPPPSSSIIVPAPGQAIPAGYTVQANAGSARGVAKVELWLNGYKWLEKPGAGFGPSGQKNPSAYALMLPADVPDGVIDVVVKAYDDLGAEGDSPAVTVTKGAPCTSADTCAKGQKCDAGKCYWDAASGKLGDSCTYPQFCMSGLCEGTADQQICTQTCIVGATDACPSGFDCVDAGGGNGVCFFKDNGGCCSVGHEASHAVWVHAGFAGLVLGLVMRRRRRR